MGELFTTLLEKIASGKIAATVTIASFVLIIPLFVLLSLLKYSQLVELFQQTESLAFEWGHVTPQVYTKIISILTSNTPSELIQSLCILLVAFIISCSFLTVDLMIKIKNSIKNIIRDYEKYFVKLYRVNRSKMARGVSFDKIYSRLPEEYVEFLNLFCERNLIEVDRDMLKIANKLAIEHHIIEKVKNPRLDELYLYSLKSEYELFFNRKCSLSDWTSNKKLQLSIINTIIFVFPFIYILFDILFPLIFIYLIYLIIRFLNYILL